MPEDERPPILAVSVHDVRYFAALLRGVSFINRGTVTITEGGFTIMVEEARTLLATAYVFKNIFDEYTYNPGADSPPSTQQSDQRSGTTFEIQLGTLIECLNIFGTAGVSSIPNSTSGTKYKKWKKDDGGNSDGDDDHRNGSGNRNGSGPIDKYFGAGGSEKRTSMRMSYAGPGYPLTLLVAEDAAGPTTTCEIATFDSEAHLDLPFDSSQTVLKIILKSSWMRDALSELDPSCEKLTFIGNPPSQAVQPRGTTAKPMLRIQAAGTFGSSEMDYPNDRDVLETFECAHAVSFSYRFGHISRALRALQSSTKTSLRIDEEGLLSLQFLLPSPGSGEGFIDFRCLALDEDL